MALTVTDIATLQGYLEGVMDRAAHHADNVDEIVAALAGLIVWKKDDRPIKVMERGGATKNVLWVSINGTIYVFSYNHDAKTIEMREDSVQGRVVESFTNSTPLSRAKQIFEVL